MQVKDDLLKVHQLDRDVETGEKLELEERPAERILTGTAEVSGAQSGQVFGSIPVSISRQGNLIDFAEDARTECLMCKHFNQKKWQEFKKRAERTLDGQKLLNECRTRLLISGNARVQDAMPNDQYGEPDVEYAMNFLGFCDVYSEILKDDIIVTPISRCDKENIGDYFTPKDLENQKMGDVLYDEIINRARLKTIK